MYYSTTLFTKYKKKHRKLRKNTGKEIKKSSVVWNFFHKDPEDKTKTICQICTKVLLYSGSNGSMLSHLRHHKVLQEEDDEIPCSECGKLQKNKVALKRHEKTAHERIHTGEKSVLGQELH